MAIYLTPEEIRDLVAQGQRDFWCSMFLRKVTLVGYDFDDKLKAYAWVWDADQRRYDCLDRVSLSDDGLQPPTSCPKAEED